MGYVVDDGKAQAKERILFELERTIRCLESQREKVGKNLLATLQLEFEQGVTLSIDRAKGMGQESIVGLSNAIWQLENAMNNARNLNVMILIEEDEDDD